MSQQILEIKYRCLHPSCVVNCREGVLVMDEEEFKALKAAYPEEGIFRSPRGICRLGFNQQFKVLGKSLHDEDEGSISEEDKDAAAPANDPLKVLMDEHQVVLKVLDTIEAQLRKRDIEGLWTSAAELENDVTIHSIVKEEGVLFPALRDRLPMGHGLISIVEEEHREFMSLLHAFRVALSEGDILDGIILTVITNLKSHIGKEDYEFFDLVSKSLDVELSHKLYHDMEEAQKSYTPIKAGDRKTYKASLSGHLLKSKLHDADVEEAKHETTASQSCCH